MDPGNDEGRGMHDGGGLDIRSRGRFISRQASAHLRSLPDFVMIGGMKCGTTSLFQYLQRHPGVSRVYVEEVHYFDLNYHRGINWYRAHFPLRGKDGDRRISGDDSPYYIFHPAVPRRIAKDLPDVKLIALLRDPVDRAYSHYHHEHRRGREELSFERALEKEEERLAGEVEALETDAGYVSYEHQRHSYVSRGRYAEQLRAWFDVIPEERFLILQSEAMFRDPQAIFDQVLEFLGLSPMQLTDFDVFNPGSYPKMEGGTRRMLREHFEPRNEELFKLIGRSFDW
jgi:hypothetical protein